MTWLIAADHAGVSLKESLCKHLKDRGENVIDLGGHDPQADDAFAEDADRLVEKLLKGEGEHGILVCGTGLGIAMRANRYTGIRAAVVHDEFTAKSAKAHNNANIMCLGERVLSAKTACALLDTFMATSFEGGRHIKRLEKLDAPLIKR